MARRVYVETSVWGMIPPDQDRFMRLPSLDFLTRCQQGRVSACVSHVVFGEIKLAKPETQKPIWEWVRRVNPTILVVTEEIDALADRFVKEGVVPKRRRDDARHVACAVVHGVDLLVIWNYRHIANVRKAEGFNAVAVLAGYSDRLQIHTPLEVLGWE